MRAIKLLGFIIFSLMTAQGFSWVFNNPYPKDEVNQKVYYTSFAEQPKTLDPARSYSSNEYQFIAQIYEPLLEYDYLARPYELVPLSAALMPDIIYLDADFNPIADFESQEIAYSVYTMQLKHGLHYQPHPALAHDEAGNYRYLQLPADYLDSHNIRELSDFALTGTREVIADDFIYQIKRLADPATSSPIYGLMSNAILGFKEFAKQLPATASREGFVDLRRYPLAGLKKLDDYTFQITIKGQYPQFLFWLAMPFFSPIPWEADKFYAQRGMKKNNLSFDWYPIGSGPFMLVENNPNRQMILRKNPNYQATFAPKFATVADEQAGYLKELGKPIPFLDEVIFTLEKESIPRWNKFLQGYYDLSGVTTDSFDQAIQISPAGHPTLTAVMHDKKINLTQTLESNIFYLGFNMRDPVVGGLSARARKLRLAISIAVNFDEYIAIFYNGRGRTVQGPIPPGIFGLDDGPAGINPYVYQWHNGKAVRRPLREAQRLLKEAGYARGIDPSTGRPLVLNYDVAMTTRPDEQAQLDWMRKQFARIGIDLNIRATEYNRFQEKMRYGNAQIFYWGWNADYPDPENFLNLLYGPNSKVMYGGENAANYHNTQFDHLFELMRNRPNDSLRKKLIAEMIALARHDAPWIWGINTEMLTLTQQWVNEGKPNAYSWNTLKYMTIDAPLRVQLQQQWNQAVLWPLILIVFIVILSIVPLLWIYRQQEKRGVQRGIL